MQTFRISQAVVGLLWLPLQNMSTPKLDIECETGEVNSFEFAVLLKSCSGSCTVCLL